jgi:nucleolar MIF4G domain-containing protein 1
LSDKEDEEDEEEAEKKNLKRQRIEQLNKDLKKTQKDEENIDDFSDSDFEDQYDDIDDDDFDDEADDFFQDGHAIKKTNSKKENSNSESESEGEESGSNIDSFDEEEEDSLHEDEETSSSLKEDIYGRFVDKKGNVTATEKYTPPGKRLKELLDSKTAESSMKLIRLSKQLNGLLNRLSTSNINSIANQIIQIFYSNEYTRYDLIQTLYDLLKNSLIKSNCITPMRLIIEHASLIQVLSANVGIELGATLLQKICSMIHNNLSENSSYLLENKTLDNLVLFLCYLYNFKITSSNLIVDLIKNHLTEELVVEKMDKIEKTIDVILVILRSAGFLLRKDDPINLKEIILKLQTNMNAIKSSLQANLNESINKRLMFMIESINAIKNNDIRRLDSFDQQPIEQLKKQTKLMLKEDNVLLNVSFKDLISTNELGRWWIVGSAWNLKENQNDEKSLDSDLKNKTNEIKNGNDNIFSEKILKLAKEQHMSTDVRKAVFCIILSAEVIIFKIESCIFK